MKKLIIFLLAGMICSFSFAEEKTSENNPQLKQALKKYPQADLNGDGILTETEVKEAKKKFGFNKNKPKKDNNNRQPDQANVKYGDHQRNVLDFWKAESDKPTPVLIYLHGGGFVGGNKQLNNLQKALLKDGVSAVSANYRFVATGETSLEDVMHDGARVVQFVRSKAKEWNIDPDRIAMTGSSAGGNMSVWLAYHDDLADPQSKDPVQHFSSRISCVVGYGAQTSNDPSFILSKIGGNKTIFPSLPKMYGKLDMNKLNSPEVQAATKECSAINHVTKDDPPVYLVYYNVPPKGLYPESTDIGVSIHSAKFGVLLKEKTDPLGLECVLVYPGQKANENETQFLLRNLKVK